MLKTFRSHGHGGKSSSNLESQQPQITVLSWAHPRLFFFFYFIIDLTAQSVPVNLLVLSILDRRAYFAVDVSALWVVVV